MNTSQNTSHGLISRRGFLQAGTLSAATAALAAPGTKTEQAMAQPIENGYIDAHVHVWTPDLKKYPLAPGYDKERMAVASFTPQELFAHARPCGVTRIVLIQMSYYRWDNSYMLDMMRKHQGVFSGVAKVDSSAGPRRAMIELAGQGVRGFRVGIPRRSPEMWLEEPGMAQMWKAAAEHGLSICLLINPESLPVVERMCRRFPETSVVLDHFARIGIDGEIRPADLDNLCKLSAHKRVTVKTSAYYALGKKKAPYLDLAPMFRRLLDAFGPERLMWATDCPFQVLDGHTYRESIDLVRRRLDFLSDADRDWLLRKTAERVFFS
jgi:predicted TIM-barrel fold metal-dependent hydrolase